MDSDYWKLTLWLASSQLTATSREATNPDPLASHDIGSINNLSDSSVPGFEYFGNQMAVENVPIPNVPTNDIARTLNAEQRMAYDIVSQHLLNHMSGMQQPQLLFNLQGGPGTGKSQVIKAISVLSNLATSQKCCCAAPTPVLPRQS